MKKARVHITIDKDIMPKVKEESSDKGHTISSFINYVLIQYFKNNGKDKEKKGT